MHTALTRHLFPAGNRLDFWQLIESFEQGAAIHVFANRNAEQGQHRRRYVDQTRAVDAFVAPDVGAGHDKDPVLAMPDCWASRFARCPMWPLRTAFKPVIGTQNDCCPRS